jgi:hypothetical protein
MKEDWTMSDGQWYQQRRFPFILSLILMTSLLLLVCGAPTMTVQPPAQITQEEARSRAEEIIRSEYPEMMDVVPIEKEYSRGGSNYYSLTYSETLPKQVGDKVLTTATVIIITIDKDTGEEVISISD